MYENIMTKHGDESLLTLQVSVTTGNGHYHVTVYHDYRTSCICTMNVRKRCIGSCLECSKTITDARIAEGATVSRHDHDRYPAIRLSGLVHRELDFMRGIGGDVERPVPDELVPVFAQLMEAVLDDREMK